MNGTKTGALWLALLPALVWMPSTLSSQQRYPPRTADYPIAPSQAKYYVGGVGTVCGTVTSVRPSSKNRGKPVALNLDNQPFMVVVQSRGERKKPGKPDRQFKGKEVCATGTIESVRGAPRIVIKESELVLKNK